MTQSPKKRRNFGLPMAEGEEEVTPGIICVGGFGNSGVVITDEGIVVVDAGIGEGTGRRIVKTIRERTEAPVNTIIYTHGHFDHAYNMRPLFDDAEMRSHPKPRIIAHEAVLRRFERYQKLYGHHQHINRIEYDIPEEVEVLPPEFFYPDLTYSDAMEFRLGGLTFELYHALGETDDATWVWIPERQTAIVGDLVVWSCPNIGNPLKVQRYELEWAEALEKIAGKEPAFLLPGHGPAIKGELIQEICLNTARFVCQLHSEVIRLLNKGYWIEEILEQVKIPEELANKPYLAPIYGCPTFIIHGIERRYSGWYSGNPSNLFPASSAEIAEEVVKASSVGKLLRRSKELKQEGKSQLALHLVDFVIGGTGESQSRREALQLKAELLEARAGVESSYIARNILRHGAKIAREGSKIP